MAYNSLHEFDFHYFDQVGSLSALAINASHNNIIELSTNFSNIPFGRNEHGKHSRK